MDDVYLHASGGSDEGEECSSSNGLSGRTSGSKKAEEQLQAAKFGDNLTRILLPNKQVWYGNGCPMSLIFSVCYYTLLVML